MRMNAVKGARYRQKRCQGTSARVLFFLALLFAAFITAPAQQAITDLKPTVVLVSIDGFRYDYPEKYGSRNLKWLARKGVRAKWLIPSYPTKTFPNHYTIATGLYPAHHGIVANNIYDPVFDAVFGLGKREEVENPRWWQGEPIWVTAEKQGQRAAAFFFPGTETRIGGVRPTFWRRYDGSVPNEKRVDTLLRWFDLPVEDRPTLYTLYFSTIDDAGHGFSPESPRTGRAVRKMDRLIGRLLKGFRRRSILGKVNLIIVSDHGMASVPSENRIVIDEMFDASTAKQVFWTGEFVQIFPKKGRKREIYDSIRAKLPVHAKIYLRERLPERFHYSGNRRIAPIIVQPDPGWVLITRSRLERLKATGRASGVRGSHGYDNAAESMRALFIANGAAFKKGYLAKPFSNIEIYNVMCAILGLRPAPNDGRLQKVVDILSKSAIKEPEVQPERTVSTTISGGTRNLKGRMLVPSPVVTNISTPRSRIWP